jgi:hypothetical protein
MKATKSTRPRVSKDAVSPAAAKVVDDRISKMVGPNEELWWTLSYGVLEGRFEEVCRADLAMATAAPCLSPGRADLVRLLGAWVATRGFSTAQLFELGSSEEAMHLCEEALARGRREPAGDGEVFRFPRCFWVGDPLPAEAPPEEEEDETFAKAEEPEA